MLKGLATKTVADNIHEFEEFDCIPLEININRDDEGPCIETTVQVNNTKWNKCCKNKFGRQKLDRERKRKTSENEV